MLGSALASVFDYRQPLAGETGPLEGVSHDKVVEVWGVFLPDLVLGVNQTFFQDVRDIGVGRFSSHDCRYGKVSER
jgi:hypothetical protein